MAEAAGDLGSEEREELLPEDSAGLTTQWSVEDGEEAAWEQHQQEPGREPRDRDRDRDESSHSPEQPEQEALLGRKPSAGPEVDEDEGFGDWSQKPELWQPRWAGEAPQNESPEGGLAEDRPSQRRCDSEASGGPCRPDVPLEDLHLSPEEAAGGSPGVAEDEHQTGGQHRTPSPPLSVGTAEPSSPPLSPSIKLADRTESLNRSIEKSNSVRKTQPALPISTIDERLQQYTQATESAGWTPKVSRQTSIELPSMAVANTKNLWETGEVQTQSAAKTPPCKDIVAGDMSKKSLWEQRGGCKTSSTVKSTPSGKRYKFVATGHGKYEKVSVDEGPAP
ncbi:lymphocyte-specific protein 1 isoform X1 [Dipodomys spectabilis]|uniref:lymphocyte-specific protein 1 isoform X1 n=1 Tax=Dipodomys spectabilis TaxID=105255 RepID=UPI001C54AACE|nr:lymphocyte-specific protein 1 isoform X1 [Dipodomys spectabilis]